MIRMNDDLNRRLESLRSQKTADEKSIERCRIQNDYNVVAYITEYVRKLTENVKNLDKMIAEIETEIRSAEERAS